MKLSIIVPVYKVEAYLEKCIESLQQQDISPGEYEVIIVNDGSPDGCKDIVLRLQLKFDNIVFIDQENQGVSIARNNAITKATGEYIMPIDPDDFVLTNTFKHIIDQAESQKLDVLYLGLDILDEEGRVEWRTKYAEFEGIVYNGVEGYFTGRGLSVRDPDRSVGILYKRSLLKHFNINYPADVPYLEDGLFLAKVFAVADRCGFGSRPFYQRTTRQGSATHSRLFYSQQALDGFIKAANDIRSFREKNTLTLDQQGLINHVTAKFVLLPIISCVGSKNWRAYKKIRQKIKEAGFNHLELKGCRSIYYYYASYFNKSKNWFFTYFLGQTIFNSIKCRIQIFKNNMQS